MTNKEMLCKACNSDIGYIYIFFWAWYY